MNRDTPIVLGGQGRTADSLISSTATFLVMMLLGVGLAALAFDFIWITVGVCFAIIVVAVIGLWFTTPTESSPTPQARGLDVHG
jgi:uncharacterized SAM-binding protein YcdF (DUF218 family)